MSGVTRFARLACFLLVAGASAWAQPAARTATTPEALTLYPLLFHGRQVMVRGTVQHPTPDVTSLRSGDAVRPIFLLSREGAIDEGSKEIRGEFWDLGRLTRDDAQLAGFELDSLLTRVSDGQWPAHNQVPIIIVRSAEEPEQLPSGLRAIALEPARFEGQAVTVVGRFRGANLYGDVPQAPGLGRWDFVIQSADAAVWVTGQRPRGKGFNFDATTRLDTGRSLEVTGVVHTRRGLVWIEATAIQLSTTPAPAAIVDVPVRTQGPPPQVAFSLPIDGETDVATSIKVRIQFTRDMAADTFKDRVRLSYVDASAQAPPPPSTSAYHRENRVLEITFSTPLERFRTVKVELLDGITASDGAPLAPYSMTFSLGAS
jgi:hypothetical protein